MIPVPGEIVIRPATEDDVRQLSAWRNDPPYDVYDVGDESVERGEVGRRAKRDREVGERVGARERALLVELRSSGPESARSLDKLWVLVRVEPRDLGPQRRLPEHELPPSILGGPFHQRETVAVHREHRGSLVPVHTVEQHRHGVDQIG